MPENRYIFESGNGLPYWQDCPFGGSAKVIIKKSDNGIILAKCQEMERFWLIMKDISFFQKARVRSSSRSEDFKEIMKKNGCPCPPYFHAFLGWKNRCKFNCGDWIEL